MKRPMEGNSRRVIALSLSALMCTGCSLGKVFNPPKTVKLPEQPVSKPLVLKDEQNIDIQFALARTFESEGELDQAANIYRQILQQSAKHAGATHRLAIVYDQQGLFVESEALFAKALQLQPGSADLYCDVGYSLYRQHKLSQAEMNYRQALALSPSHKRAHNHLGLVLAAQGDSENALVEFQKSGCSQTEALRNIALMQSFEGRLEEARESYAQALLQDPTSTDIATRLQEVDAVLAKTQRTAADRGGVQLANRAREGTGVDPVPAPGRRAMISTVGFEQNPQPGASQGGQSDEIKPQTTSTPDEASWWKRLTKGRDKSAG